MYIILTSFALLYIVTIFSTGEGREKQQRLMLIVCVILAFLAGTRNPDRWADTWVYVRDFLSYSPPLYDYSVVAPYGYDEKGFHFLGSIVKTFTDDYVAYLLFVSAITFYVLYYDFKKYCIIPLLGVCDYVARFYLNRNFIQIRSALAIAIVIFAIQYAFNKDWRRYFLFIFIAYLFHHSSLIAVPFYFFNKIKFKKWHVVFGLVLAMIASVTLAPAIRDTVEQYSSDLQYEAYVGEEYQQADIGLRNPMIWLQLFLLLYFTFFEKRLKQFSEYYYLFRNAYFYSTLILITFSQYTALSGRTSTMFATVEIAMVPILAMSFKKNQRLLFYVITGVLLFFFFMLKQNTQSGASPA